MILTSSEAFIWPTRSNNSANNSALTGIGGLRPAFLENLQQWDDGIVENNRHHSSRKTLEMTPLTAVFMEFQSETRDGFRRR